MGRVVGKIYNKKVTKPAQSEDKKADEKKKDPEQK